MNLHEGEDRGYEIIVTPGGPQRIRVLTFKGLTKFLMRSSHQKAVEFQDSLASKSSDLAFYGVAFSDRSATEEDSINLLVASTLSSLTARLDSLESKAVNTVDILKERVDALEKAQARPQYLPRPKSGKKAPREVSPATAQRLKTVERFLEECCERADGAVTAMSELAARFEQWAKDNRIKPVTNNWLGRTISAMGIPLESVGPKRVRSRPFIRLKPHS